MRLVSLVIVELTHVEIHLFSFRIEIKIGIFFQYLH